MWTDPKTYTVPNVVDKSVSDAKKELEGFTVSVEGAGDKVIYQSPEAGVKLEEGSTIRLFTN